MRHILFFFLLISNSLFSQNNKEFIDFTLINKTNIADVFLEGKNLKNIFLNDDSDFLGFYSKNKYKVNVKILSVIKDFEKNTKYWVYGKMKCKDIISDFQGVIIVNSINHYINNKNRLLIEAEYKLKTEFLNEKLCSIEGKSFYKIITEKEKIDIDYTDIWDDYYSYAMYIGYIIDMDKKKSVLNWGSFGIPPLCGDLDIGKETFIPNPKYKKYGWEKMINIINNFKGAGCIIFDTDYWWKDKR